jgi:hypothetical protein
MYYGMKKIKCPKILRLKNAWPGTLLMQKIMAAEISPNPEKIKVEVKRRNIRL